MSPHELVTSSELAPPSGYAHAVVATAGRTVYLGGQTAQGLDGSIVGGTLTEQFGIAAANVAAALRAAGGRPVHLVQLVIYVTDVPAYRAALGELGALYREYFGRHYPAIALIGASELFDPAAKIELLGTAVIPDDDHSESTP